MNSTLYSSIYGQPEGIYDVAIIGAGVIGASAAYEFSRYNLKIALLEKENDVSCGTSRANSAIVHAGYDPRPGTQMAKLNVRGNRLMKKIAAELSVPIRHMPSFVLGYTDDDLKLLNELLENGRANGLEHVEIISKEEVLALEPNISQEVRFALYSKDSAIIDPMRYTTAVAETAVRNGVEFMRCFPVISINRDEELFHISDGTRTVKAKFIVNAAGLYSDKIHELAGGTGFHIRVVSGQYFLLDKSKLVSSVVFTCPTDKGKGVLVSPTVHGNLIVGPDAQKTEERDKTPTDAEGLHLIREMAEKMVNGISFRDNIRNFSGNRAYTEHEDFVISMSEQVPNFLNLAGIKSPGFTSAPAIAEEAVKLYHESGHTLNLKESFICTRNTISFKEKSRDQKKELIASNPLYGRIICRCETISEGEILDAVHSPIPPISIDGVKRRCGSGMGRCQGGFCSPRIHEILARELQVPVSEITKDREGSIIVIQNEGDESDDQN